MPQVLIDQTLIDKFLTRGVDSVYPSKEALREKLMSGERIRAYQGFDPTGPYLHVGHAMGIRALRILQQLGHEVIFLIGDYTAKVGDPDKDTARKILTDQEIEKNREGWIEQASQLIDFEGENPVQFKRNHDWLSELKLEELIKLLSTTTVQQTIEREMFQKRLAKNDPIGLQEFIYPLMQGFDSVAMEVDLEIGGTDQTFNMLMGRTLVKKYLGKEKFVRTNRMMDAPDAVTMSKTKGNGINLSDSAEDMYGKAMSYPDELILKGMDLLTELPLEEILVMEKALEADENPMKYKKIMAFEIVKVIKGEEAARKAEKHFENTVQKGEFDEDCVGCEGADNIVLSSFLKKILPEESSSQIRRVIEQGGVEINGEKVTDPNQIIDFGKGTKLKYGKRKFFEVE
jgi:tyrosyl-tRNA synthetase